MAKIIETATGVMALTFDDVLLQPGHSEVMPGGTDISTRIAGDIDLNVPILSAAMDTVTEARLAIAMAQAGGIGVIHRNFTPAEQAEQVRQVKKFESGMVVNPVTIGPDATLADALALMKAHGISGIPVVENGGTGGQKRGHREGAPQAEAGRDELGHDTVLPAGHRLSSGLRLILSDPAPKTMA